MRRVRAESIKPQVVFVILTPVVSSNVHSIGFSNGVMYVKYHKDIKTEVIYQFPGMEQEKYAEIKNSESIGSAIHATGIKGTKI